MEKCFNSNGWREKQHESQHQCYVAESDIHKETIFRQPFGCEYDCEHCRFFNYCSSRITIND